MRAADASFYSFASPSPPQTNYERDCTPYKVRLRTPYCVRLYRFTIHLTWWQLPRALGFSGGDDDFAGLGAVPPFERRFYQCIVKSGMRMGGEGFVNSRCCVVLLLVRVIRSSPISRTL